MIAFVRVAGIKFGQTGAAMAFARQMASYLKETYRIDVEVLRPVGGNPQRVAWSARHADMAAMEAFTSKLLADSRYWDLVNSAADCFVAGSMHDSIWQSV